MITQIVEYVSLDFNLSEDVVVEGKSKINMEALVHQGMIYVYGNTYTMFVENKFVLDLPKPRKVRIDILSNWIYQVGAPSPDTRFEDESEPENSNHHVCTSMEEDVVPPLTCPTQHEAGASNAYHNRWDWVQSKIQEMWANHYYI